MHELYGLILTGGMSRRMGREKASLSYHGRPHWQYLGEALRPFVSRVYWSCTKKQKDEWRLGDHGIVDKNSECGPAEGLRTAFGAHPLVAWLVLGCDYPFLTTADLRQLREARDEHADATAFLNPEDGGPEPFLAIWEPGAQAKLLQDGTSPRRSLMSSRIKLVAASSATVVTNVNTAEEYEKIFRHP